MKLTFTSFLLSACLFSVASTKTSFNQAAAPFTKTPVLFIKPPVFIKKSQTESTVDQRVELVSIIFRLAGNPEYNMKFAKNYIKDIHDYFDKYKNEPVINFARELSQEKGMGFSRVMFLVVNLEFKDNKFSLIKVSKNSMDGKWAMDDAVKFVNLLNDFYKISAFDIFFKNHQENYKQATDQFNNITASFDTEWYLNYYGEHSVDYRTVLGLANGGANYGPDVFPADQKKIVYAIMGSWIFDEAGNPVFLKNDYLPTLVHEFNHSFVNHILDEDDNAKLLAASSEVLLDAQRNEMKLEAYEDWKSLINESLVRACVVRYLIDHKNNQQVIKDEILLQTNKGFIWTKELVSLLGEYESSRTQYPDFKSFYPRIITFFNETARDISKIKAAYVDRQPKVTTISPFKNGEQDVAPLTSEIVINFDRQVTGKGSIRYGESGKEHFGVTKVVGYLNNNRSCRLALELKPDTTYEFILSGDKFKSATGYSLQDYLIKFKTKSN
ncbi:hypothetical protein HDE68_001024 [Pedobacter cryoconitis]|uniref:DUF4932 domain-containing protein n=1 Tax=Pedobacter cryoconitis TaxID=188932 RepID=A0A7W9DYF0_9SPHI|nr:DUF4932 domain-containing protein [Pedobacter cryoconitis]MBB5635139.1 hypothetical protein [Pedobacter cryoconitis]